MTIFTRRILQRIINENRRFLSELQVQEHLNRLNRKDEQSIATEWEIVLLNALSKIGNVKHEKAFVGTSLPDIEYISKDQQDFIFIADITTISDKSYHDHNPVKYFTDEVSRFLKKHNVLRGIHIKFDAERIGEYSNQRMELLLPKKEDIPGFVKNNFEDMVLYIKNKPDICHFNQAKINNGYITISYDPFPLMNTISCSYLVYKLSLSIKNNPIYNRLTKKQKQIKKTNFNGVCGLFVCDGDCDLLNLDRHLTHGEYSLKEIINEFFKNYKTISFICIISVSKQNNGLKVNFYRNHNSYSEMKLAFYEELRCFIDYLPYIRQTPSNALSNYNQQKQKKARRLVYGGYSIGMGFLPDIPLSIKLPSRTLIELLSRRLPFTDFNINYGDNLINCMMDNKNENPLNQMSRLCRNILYRKISIKKLTIERCIEDDDDWINIDFETFPNSISSFDFYFYRCNTQEIKVSYWSVLIFLSGIELSEANQLGYIITSNNLDTISTFFMEKLNNYQMITEIQLAKMEYSTNEVLDKIAIITFGDRDAAISPFF